MSAKKGDAILLGEEDENYDKKSRWISVTGGMAFKFLYTDQMLGYASAVSVQFLGKSKKMSSIWVGLD